MKSVRSVFAANTFRDRVVLITGGGTGIGLRTAKEFVKLGALVVLASRKLKVLKAAAAAINEEYRFSSQRAFPVQCNIRDPASLKACVRQALLSCGKIDILVCNAGGQFPAPACVIRPKGWRAYVL
jgi:NAD(P)-dependent dehydrogenase (short-subunit alcohol dehydrogenase family)